jgi:hypothetical protein
MNLDLDGSHRDYLHATFALTTDAEGNETLVGLTRDESVEYLCVMSGPSIGPNLREVEDPLRFLRLYDRHTMALNSTSTLFPDSINKSMI